MTDTGPEDTAASHPSPPAPVPSAAPATPGAYAYPAGAGSPAGAESVVPPTPQGPGAVPPFPAPPTEGRSSRLWLGLGLGALALLLCCGGGGAAVFGIGTVAARALNEQVDVVVGEYFDAVRQKRLDDAYAQLCEDAQQAESRAEFARRVGAEPAIMSYEVGDITLASVEPVVPVEVVRADGATETLQVDLRQDQSTGQFEVCGVEG